jgi:DNA repair protein RadC
MTVARNNPPRVFRAQKVVAQLQKETRPAFSKGMIVTTPRGLVEETLDEYLSERATEVFLVLYLSVRNQVLGYTEYASGGISGVEVNTSGVMRDALISGAAGIITIHNHPSGDATPSAEDRALWNRMREAGLLIGVPVVDNMVIGEEQFFSEMEGSTIRFHRKERS